MRINWGWRPGKFRCWLWGISLGFCLASGLGFLWAGDWACGLICLGTGLLVSLPLGVGFLGWQTNPWFYAFVLLYAMGPMLGKAYQLYYLTTWWDKLLHTSAGVVFAVIGIALVPVLNGNRETGMALRVVFGVCFSIALSALWELVEFGVDTFFGGDMQNDTIIYSIHSYLLSDTPGTMASIEGIRQTTVNGLVLPEGGYLDIGLIDTMCDVLVESCGAVCCGIWYGLDRERHPLLYRDLA